MVQIKKNKAPLFIGIIVDVSSSMRRNWKNQDGESMPRIEAVRDALNSQFQKISLYTSSKSNKSRSINIFCLGMGFKRPMYWSDVRISYGREELLDSESEKRTDTGVVCDILALSEIVPNEAELRKLETAINKKWHLYTQHLLERAKIDDNVYQQLQEHIQASVYESAYKRLYKGVPYKLFLKLKNNPNVMKVGIGASFIEKLSRYIVTRETRIGDLSVRASKKYFDGILKESKKIFDEEKDTYVAFIGETLHEFVSTYTNTLLHLLTLGHSIDLVLDYFDEEKVVNLAREIYQHLEREVRRSIRVAWTLNRGSLFVTAKSLGASLSSKDVQNLTEKCVQKYSWNILEPFVKQTVRDVFTDSFKMQAKEMMPEWIGLAAKREVSRTPRQIANLLPDSLAEIIYSEEFMFGSTPVDEAMNLASLRMLDKSRKNKERILVLISDGEFSTSSPIFTAGLLKQANVKIICCYLTDRNIMTQLTSRSTYFWPEGAKELFEMASTISKDDPLIDEIAQKGYHFPDGTKLFYQINQSEILEDVINALIHFEK